jgi:hypothetical protein
MDRVLRRLVFRPCGGALAFEAGAQIRSRCSHSPNVGRNAGVPERPVE